MRLFLVIEAISENVDLLMGKSAQIIPFSLFNSFLNVRTATDQVPGKNALEAAPLPDGAFCSPCRRFKAGQVRRATILTGLFFILYHNKLPD